MAVRERSVADEAAELRLRLYRPDPPADAVEAYLEALARLPPAATPEPRPPSVVAPRGRRRAVLLVATGLAGALALAVALREAPAPAAPTAVSATATPRAPAVRMPPVLGTLIGVLSGGDGTTAAFDAGGLPVVVSVLCSREGTIGLRIDGGAETVLTCQRGTTALALVPSTGPLGRFTIEVRPDGPVRWVLAVGAGPAAA